MIMKYDYYYFNSTYLAALAVSKPPLVSYSLRLSGSDRTWKA